ncbi:MAG: hypothetical protein AAGB18_05805 [Pseudomonadota bacterium]
MGEEWRRLQDDEASVEPALDAPPYGAMVPNRLQSLLTRAAQGFVLHRGVLRARPTRAVLRLGSRPLDVHIRGAAFRLRGEKTLMEHALWLNPRFNAADIDVLTDGAGRGAGAVP